MQLLGDCVFSEQAKIKSIVTLHAWLKCCILIIDSEN